MHSPSQLLRPPKLPQSAEEAEQLTMLVQQLQSELLDERGRVDALKSCLEQVDRIAYYSGSLYLLLSAGTSIKTVAQFFRSGRNPSSWP